MEEEKLRIVITHKYCHKCGGGELTFGPYKGKHFPYVMEEYPKYCEDILHSDDTFYRPARYNSYGQWKVKYTPNSPYWDFKKFLQ